MTRAPFLAIALLITMLLSACGEKDQTLSQAGKKPDGKAWEGAHNPFVAQGWQAGDKTSWETQLRTRAERQNEYARTN